MLQAVEALLAGSKMSLTRMLASLNTLLRNGGGDGQALNAAASAAIRIVVLG
jgi:hypothetical protein